MKKIKMNVKKIETVSEVNEDGFIWIDRLVYFDALTPLSETDTCAMITRYFESSLDFNISLNDFDTSINIEPPLSKMSGLFKIGSEKNKDPVHQSKYNIPVARELIQLIKKNKYQYQDECVEQFVLAWVGDVGFIYEN